MIDIAKEQLLTLSEAASLLPSPGGRKVHTSTLWRWAKSGLRGIHLEYVRMGRRIYTTEAALSHFGRQLTEVEATEPADEVSTRKPSSRDAAYAEKILDQAGI